MSDIEYIKYNNCPFIAIAVGSFDLLSGIRLCHGWVFQQEENISENLGIAFKITLANVHRQKEEYFSTITTSTVDIESLNWFIANAIFLFSPINQPAAKKNKFMSVIFILKPKLLKSGFYFRNSLMLLTKKFAQNVINSMKENQPIQSLKNVALNYVSRGTSLIQSGIPSSFYNLDIDFNLPSTDLYFYSTLLTSHLQTKMVTVIETSSLSEAFKIVSFLINFMFPFQIDQSSIELALKPNPYLFVQVIQKQLPKDTIQNYKLFEGKKFTLIKLLDKRQIFQISHSSKAKSNDHLFDEKLVYSEESDFLKNYWSIVTCQLLLNSQNRAEREIICKQQFSEFVRFALLFLTQSDKSEKEQFRKMLEMNDQDEKAILAVSHLLQINNMTD